MTDSLIIRDGMVTHLRPLFQSSGLFQFTAYIFYPRLTTVQRP